MKRPERLALSLAALLVLAGCSQPPSLDGVTSAPTGSPAAPTSSSTSTAAVPLEEEDAHPAEPVPSPAATDVDAAIAAAELVVDLFARPAMEQTSWLNELMPHLSQTGAPLFATIKPSSITSTVRLGPGELMADASEYVVLVKVPTDAGVLAVSLSRSNTDSAWRVDRIRPVEG